MVPITDLIIPILVSAVFVFIASSVIHMALPIHKSDYKQIPGEETVLAGIRDANLAPGTYMFPHCGSMKAMGEPAHIEKLKRGPVGHMTLLPNGPMAMGKFLTLWFIFSVVVSFFSAYLTAAVLGPGADYLAVFRVAGTAAFMAYGLSNVTDSIWKGVSWCVTAKFLVDGLVYALLTAGTFGWLWPGA